MSRYYPDNVNPNDKDAPWNRPDAVYEPCEECGGLGYTEFIEEGDLFNEKCEACEGEGQVEVEDDE